MAKYTDKEIKDIKRWRGEGLTWAEIEDRNGRSAKAMSMKFSKMTLGVPEYKEPTITVKHRVLKEYAVKIDVLLKYDSLEDAAKLVKGFNDLTQVSQYYSGEVKMFETNEIEI